MGLGRHSTVLPTFSFGTGYWQSRHLLLCYNNGKFPKCTTFSEFSSEDCLTLGSRITSPLCSTPSVYFQKGRCREIYHSVLYIPDFSMTLCTLNSHLINTLLILFHMYTVPMVWVNPLTHVYSTK